MFRLQLVRFNCKYIKGTSELFMLSFVPPSDSLFDNLSQFGPIITKLIFASEG